jgi:hypothetical protein
MATAYSSPHNPPPPPHQPTLQRRFQELNELSSREAATLAAQGIRVKKWWLVVSPVCTFARVYIWQGEWRRGVAGLITAFFAAYTVFVRYAKLWELQYIQIPSAPPPEDR